MPGNVVDNRVFLLGLDEFYRNAMKSREAGELLDCARRVAGVLQAVPASGVVEGYYAENARLTEYFQWIRSLQRVDEGAIPSVESLPEFQRLREVLASPLFGRPQVNGYLLPSGRDALTQALHDNPSEWSIARLVPEAHRVAAENDEISLVGLAARAQDAVVLAALRESVVLYAELYPGAVRVDPRYAWDVDPDLVESARRFVDVFNGLFGDVLPRPEPANARAFWTACQENDVLGRCVRIGWNDSTTPQQHYHWAIRFGETSLFAVQEFWSPEIWTTERYRKQLVEEMFPTSEKVLMKLPKTLAASVRS